MKDQGQLYVPKPDGMSTANYNHYLDRACFYGAPEMTLRALVGLALRNRNETIDTATQRTRSELALLHGVVASVEAGLNRLLRLAAEWVGDDPDEASVTLSRDFIESSMEPKMIEQQMKLYLSGIISRATLHENLQKGEIVRADRSWEDEKDMIFEDGGDISPIIGTR